MLWASNEPIGNIKLAAWRGRGLPEVELGYALLPAHWGRGYATEAGHGAVTFAKEVLSLPKIVAFTLPENQASLSVMDRLGFKRQQRLVVGGRDHVLRERDLV